MRAYYWDMANAKFTAKQARAMVGCSVSYRGHEAKIVSARWDMQMLEVTWDGGRALIKPSELR